MRALFWITSVTPGWVLQSAGRLLQGNPRKQSSSRFAMLQNAAAALTALESCRRGPGIRHLGTSLLIADDIISRRPSKSDDDAWPVDVPKSPRKITPLTAET